MVFQLKFNAAKRPPHSSQCWIERKWFPQKPSEIGIANGISHQLAGVLASVFN